MLRLIQPIEIASTFDDCDCRGFCDCIQNAHVISPDNNNPIWKAKLDSYVAKFNRTKLPSSQIQEFQLWYQPLTNTRNISSLQHILDLLRFDELKEEDYERFLQQSLLLPSYQTFYHSFLKSFESYLQYKRKLLSLSFCTIVKQKNPMRVMNAKRLQPID